MFYQPLYPVHPYIDGPVNDYSGQILFRAISPAHYVAHGGNPFGMRLLSEPLSFLSDETKRIFK